MPYQIHPSIGSNYSVASYYRRTTMAEYHLRIKELPPSEQPRERLRDHGPAALSDAELLAILLRVGVAGTNVVQLAQHLLVERGGWPGLLRTDYADLCRRHGIGEAKAAALKAALEIGRRLLLTEHEQRLQIKSPTDVAALLMLEMSHLEQEHLRTVLLDTKNRVQTINTAIQMQCTAPHCTLGDWPGNTETQRENSLGK